MTFENYLANGGDREEKLVAIYKTHPERLSEDYRALFKVMESTVLQVAHLKDHELYGVLMNWDRIRTDLEKQGADFV